MRNTIVPEFSATLRRVAAKQKPCLQGVLFDWDGTLIDSYDADSSAYLAMFKEMGIAWGIEELEKHYSPDWYQVYRAAKLPRRLWKEADRAWRAHYAKHQPKLISGARRVLEAIRTKHRLGLVTSGDRHRVARQLREFRLTRLFSARVCSCDTLKKKPHPAPLRTRAENRSESTRLNSSHGYISYAVFCLEK